jgi:MFS family permease
VSAEDAAPAAPVTDGGAATDAAGSFGDPAESVTLRSIALAAFLPPALFSVAAGAITPVIPLTATGLGASTAVAAAVVALLGLGQLLADPPAGSLTARYGERTVMIGAGILCAAALITAMLASSLIVFGAAVFVIGVGTAVWMLARLTFVAELVPFHLRARAMSTLGGVQRMGFFIGPFLGAGAVHLFGTAGAYGVGAAAAIVATVVLAAVTSRSDRTGAQTDAPQVGYRHLLRSERRVFLTVGLGVLLVSVVRSSRQVVLPLWGEHLALAPATISLIYGAAGAVDMAFFYPAGRLMDLRGRAVVAVTSMLGLAAALLLLPLTTSVVTFTLVALLAGLGNGMGSGIVMTLGADLSPPGQRPTFFGIWRVISDTGTGAGPFLLAGIAAAVSLGAGVIAMGGVALLAAAAMGHWIPRHPPRR